MHQDIFLKNIVIIIATAVVVVATLRKLRISPVLGYFVAGSVLSEHGMNIVTHKETEFFGEIGVVFLLFAIGLELTFERLKAMRKHVFGFGSMQVIISMIVLGSITYYLIPSSSAAIIIGGGLALSSTAIVLQVIAENRDQTTQMGRLSLAILLMQDFAVVPLLVIVPILAGEQKGVLIPLSESLIKAVLCLVTIFILGRTFLRPVYRAISSYGSGRNNELFIATTLLIALGTAWITNKMGLSLALGAFAAGLLVAETEFQLQAEESIAPFKGLLLGLFFMSVGMSIDVPMIIEKLPIITLLSVSIILIKATIIVLLCLLFNFSLGVGIHTGLLLSQGGEFAFILFRLADNKGIIDDEIGQMLLLVVTITMAVTPLIAVFGKWVSNTLSNKDHVMNQERAHKDLDDLNNHVIVIGVGRVGKMVCYILGAENINYVAVDINAEYVTEERKNKIPVYLGDAGDIKLMKSLGIERASSIIIATENRITNIRISKVIRNYMKDIPIIARAADFDHADDLYKAGIDVIVPETYETGLQLGGAVLKSVGINEAEISRLKNKFRHENYSKISIDQTNENNEENNKNEKNN